MLNIVFYEAFKEEEQALKRHLPAEIKAGFTWMTIQEYAKQHDTPSAKLFSIRTQSMIPISYAIEFSGLLTRSTGYDHIHDYLNQCQTNLPCGYLPLYCNRAVAEQTMILWMSLLR